MDKKIIWLLIFALSGVLFVTFMGSRIIDIMGRPKIFIAPNKFGDGEDFTLVERKMNWVMLEKSSIFMGILDYVKEILTILSAIVSLFMILKKNRKRWNRFGKKRGQNRMIDFLIREFDDILLAVGCSNNKFDEWEDEFIENLKKQFNKSHLSKKYFLDGLSIKQKDKIEEIWLKI